MAKGKKTGGGPLFTKGHTRGGRPKGAKDKVSRKGIREMFQNIVERSGSEIEAALEKRIKRSEPRLIELVAGYLDGKPVQRVQLETPQPILFEFTGRPPGDPPAP